MPALLLRASGVGHQRSFSFSLGVLRGVPSVHPLRGLRCFGLRVAGSRAAAVEQPTLLCAPTPKPINRCSDQLDFGGTPAEPAYDFCSKRTRMLRPMRLAMRPICTVACAPNVRHRKMLLIQVGFWGRRPAPVIAIVYPCAG